MAHATVARDGLTVLVHRYGFLRPGFYAEARNAAGERLSFTGVYTGKGSKRRAVEAALTMARTGQPAADDRGCPG
jgi:hypothetical protein